MRGLRKVPSEERLHKAINRLQIDLARNIPTQSSRRMALFTQWSRFDGRLAEVLAQYILRFFKNINWPQVWMKMQTAPWPQTLEVFLRFCEMSLKSPDREIVGGLIVAQRKLFPPSFAGLFFIPLQRQPFVTSESEVTWCLSPYAAAGFIGSMPLIRPSHGEFEHTLLNWAQRQKLIEKLKLSRTSFSVDEYIEICRGLVSRRQAQRDLAAANLKSRGHTRRRRYTSKVAEK